MTEIRQLGFDIEPAVTEVKTVELIQSVPELSITVTDYQGADHVIFASNPDYVRLKTAYDMGSRVFSDWDLMPDKAIEEAESILEDAGMICSAAEEDNNLNTFRLFKSIMDDKYKLVIDSLAKTRFDMVTELHDRLLAEVKRLENLEEYDTRYFRVLYQAAVVSLALEKQ